MSESPAQLKEAILAAFADSQYPGDDNLVRKGKAAGIGSDYDKVVEIFKGKRLKDWLARPLEVLSPKANDAIFFMSPEAHAYYLPLYLLASVSFYSDADMVPDQMISSLCPILVECSAEAVSGRLAKLNKVQLEATLSVLKHLREKHGEDLSLKHIDAAIAAVAAAAKSNH